MVRGASSNRGEPAPGSREPAPSCGEPAPWCGEPAPGSGEPAPSCGEPAPRCREPAPTMGSQPRQRGGPSTCWPYSWVLPRQGARACVAPRTPRPLLPPITEAVGASEGPRTTNHLRQAERPANLQGAFGGSRASGGRARSGSGQPGAGALWKSWVKRAGRTCPVTPLSPPGWPRQFSNPSQTPGTRLPSLTQPSSWKCQKTRDAGVCHGAWLRALSEVGFPVCPGAQRAGLCWPPLPHPLPGRWLESRDAAVRAAAGSCQPWERPQENCLEAARKWGVIVTAQVTVTA